MALEQKISENLKLAMKGGDQVTLGVLRMVISAFRNKSIEKKGKGQAETLTEEEVLDLLNKELKKRKDAASLYQQGNRADLAAQEEKEAAIIQKYLPAQLSKEEVGKKISEILNKTGAKDFGSAMKAVMAELRGKADAKIVSEIVKSKLG